MIRSSMSYLCLFFHALVMLPPPLGRKVKQTGFFFFFPLKAKPLVCETGRASRTRSEAEADGDDDGGSETLSRLNPIIRVFQLIPARSRMIGTVFEEQNSYSDN